MKAVLCDEALDADPAPDLVPRRPRRRSPIGGDPLVDAASHVLSVPLRQLYAALWRVGVLEVLT